MMAMMGQMGQTIPHYGTLRRVCAQGGRQLLNPALRPAYDMSRDGRRCFMLRVRAEEALPTTLHVVLRTGKQGGR